MTIEKTTKAASAAETIDLAPETAVEAASPKSSPKSGKGAGEKSTTGEDDKLKRRAEKFGIYSEELESDKKKARADRFKIFHPDLEADKKKNRAKRFETEDCAGTEGKKIGEKAGSGDLSDTEKLKNRAKRFGDSLKDPPSGDMKDTSKLLDRAKRFSIDCPELESAKRQKRMERFAGTEGTDDVQLSTEKPSKTSHDRKMEARAQKFGMSVLSDEEKKKLRANRFK